MGRSDCYEREGLPVASGGEAVEDSAWAIAAGSLAGS